RPHCGPIPLPGAAARGRWAAAAGGVDRAACPAAPEAPAAARGGMGEMSRFTERLATGPPLVGDGGMGTLVSSAVPRLRCPEEANLRAPESGLSLHRGFSQAGADLI